MEAEQQARNKEALVAGGAKVTLGYAAPSILGGVLWILASRLIGEEGVGLASAIVSSAFLASTVGLLGFDVAVVRNTWRMGLVSLTTSLITSLPLVLIISTIIAVIVSNKIGGYIEWIIAFSLMQAISNPMLWMLIGASMESKFATISLTSSIAKLAFGLVGAALWGPLGVVSGFIAANLVAIVISIKYIVKFVKFPTFTLNGFFSIDVFKDALVNYPNNLAMGIVAQAGTILAVLLAEDLHDVGVFYLSFTLVLLAGSFSYSLSYVFMAGPPGSHNLYREALRYAVASTVVAVSPMLAAPEVFYRILGVEGDTIILRILSLSVVGYASLYMVVSFLNTRGDRVRILAVGATRIVGFILLSIMLAWFLRGAVSVALAYTLSTYIALLPAWRHVEWGLLARSLLVVAFGGITRLARAPLILAGIFSIVLSSLGLLIMRIVVVDDVKRILKYVVGRA